MVKVGIKERLQAAMREKVVSTTKKVDVYISENLPDLANEHKLATKSDFGEINKTFEMHEEEVEDLEVWRDKTRDEVSEMTERVERLELKYGIGGE